MPDKTGLSYADAGVNIDAGNELVERIKPMVARTSRPGILGGIGGFGGMFELPVNQFEQPVMVSGTDGVGTKLRLAIDLNLHDTVGIDLVAMCVNDILVCGAEPLWFLDYFATGKLDVDQASRVIGGIAEGCVQAGAALLGGETAEMPGMYEGDDYDLCGFAVGVVEKNRIIDGTQLQAGDQIIGIAASGPHSNGYSLIRKVIESHDINMDFEGTTLGKALMTPTRIYVKAIQSLLKTNNVKAMAHITGGGLLENIPRCLPDGLCAKLQSEQITLPPIFEWLQNAGNIDLTEMRRTFNCGIGMVLMVPQAELDSALQSLQASGETALHIGEIGSGDKNEVLFL